MVEEIKGDLQTARQKGVIPVLWDAQKKEFVVALRGVVMNKAPNSSTGVNIYFKPPVLYDVRIRKVGFHDWGPGFLSPSSAATFVGLEPDTDYEVQVSPVDELGDPVPDSDIMKNRFHTMGHK